ncbi:MAG: cysteine desulfurase NifS [Chloroflexi bacterium RBG_13_60_13]|nr:MAG: cysteine desulfurase NifS [Chloroflexi bacterium RBG_13_60_13]
MKRIYLDHAATTPTHPEVVQAMLPFFGESFGNPSSIHFFGQESRAAVDEAREKIASLIGALSEEVVFTSGGTEADNLALKGAALANRQRGNHIITTSIEHHAVLRSCLSLEEEGFLVSYLPVDTYGLVDPDEVRKAVGPGTILVSIMHANNEVGTIQPVADIAAITRERGIYLHTDAVQTVGHVPVDVDALGVDLLSMSAHKLYGPKGIGALYVRRGTRIAPFMHGGGQERGLRASTENTPGIVGFGKAAELAQKGAEAEARHLASLRDWLVQALLARVPQLHVNGHPSQRLPNNVNVGIEFVEGEAVAISLDLEGIAASTGSACSSHDQEPSHILLAMGVPAVLARGSIRFSLGRTTTEEDVRRVAEVLPRIVARLRSMSPLLENRAGTA